MAGRFSKVSPGSSLNGFPAAFYNALVDIYERADREWNRTGGQPEIPGRLPETEIFVKNNSGADRKQFEILAITGMVFSPSDNEEGFKNGPLFSGGTPSYTSTIGYRGGTWCVLLEPVASGKVGLACIAGVVPVKIDVQATSDTWAEVTSVATKLQSAAWGSAQILYKESGTGEKWGIVRLGVAPDFDLYGYTLNNLTANGTCSVEVFRKTSSSSFVTTGNILSSVGDSFLYQGLTLPAKVMVRLHFQADSYNSDGSYGRWEIAWVPRLDGQTMTTFSTSSSGTVLILAKDRDGNAINASMTVYSPWVLYTGTITAEKRVTVAWNIQNKRWEIDARDC